MNKDRVFTEKSAALITVIMLVIVLTILSSVILSLLANQSRLIEHGIARIKAKYATEATMVREVELARRGTSFESTHNVSGRYDNETKFWNIDIASGASPFPNTTELSISLNYTIL